MRWSIPDRIIQQARECVDEGRVFHLTQDELLEQWEAEVLDDKKYHISLDGTPKENDRCTCAFWQTKGYCKHTIAVELYLKDLGYQRVMAQNKTTLPLKKAPSVSEKLLQQAQNWQLEKQQVAPPLSLVVIFDVHEVTTQYKKQAVLGVWLKMGLLGDKEYVVKDIGLFLQQFTMQERYETNQGSFLLTEQTLGVSNYALLSEWVKLREFESVLLNQQKGLLLPKKMMLLPAQIVLNWQKTYADVALEWHVNGKKKKVRGQAKGLPFLTTIVETKKGLHVSVAPKYDVALTYERLFLQQGYWIELSVEQMQSYRLLEEWLKRLGDGELFFEKARVSDFFMHVFPLLELVSQLAISQEMANRLNQEPLFSELRLDIKKDQLIAVPSFFYGEEEVRTVADKTYLIRRDLPQEARLLASLTNHQFIETSDGYQKERPQAEALYNFFTSEYPTYQRLFSKVNLSNDLQKLYLAGMKFQPQITLDLERSWLAIEFNIEGISQTEVDGMLTSLLKRRPFHQFSDGAVLDLSDDYYQDLAQTLVEIGQTEELSKGHLRLPKYQSIALAQKLADKREVSLQPAFKEMLFDLAEYDTQPLDVPKTLEGELRPYQLSGFKWLWMLRKYGFGGILADDMGLGKTIQAITYLLAVKEEKPKQPSLIISPASLIYNWKKELARFAPDLKVALISGDNQERQKLLTDDKHLDVLITSYSTYRQDSQWYQGKVFDTLILDEAQMVKNAATKTFKAIQLLNTSQRFALSGTPIENRVSELWSLFHLLMPHLLPGEKAFEALEISEIKRRVQPFMLRRTKSQVLPELPEKIESTLYSELLPEQKTLYLAQLQAMQEQMQHLSSQGFQEQRFSILAGITRLRQICCSPVLLSPEYGQDSGKLNQLKELLQASLANQRRILVFSQFTSMLNVIETELTQLGIGSFYLRGSTPSKKRQQMVDAFNGGEKSVFLISLKAGGTGLNLTGADTVILYDLWWNPAVEEQAMGRAHRIGQEKEVEVWRLVAEGTIEEKIAQLQQEKKELFTDIFDTRNTPLSEQDIRSLLLE